MQKITLNHFVWNNQMLYDSLYRCDTHMAIDFVQKGKPRETDMQVFTLQ